MTARRRGGDWLQGAIGIGVLLLVFEGWMRGAIPTADDFLSEEFLSFIKSIHHPFQLHRKLWEWTFIVHHLTKERKLQPGMRGLAFGVGQEPLPALFASMGCEIVATDAPGDVVNSDWAKANQHSDDASVLFKPSIIDSETFQRRVTFEFCDMNFIPRRLRGFDFCWSSCCFEHLGDLERGLQFVINSLDTLQPGGIAVHTTEFNLSSNDDTLAEGPTVIYRERDIETLFQRVRHCGHKVRPLSITKGTTAVDQYVDALPYRHDLHLKINLHGYNATSLGIVVEKV
jgi:hypothetical protein